jgi:hypothetical protein
VEVDVRFNPDEYITVHERIEKFYVKWPHGRVITTVLEHDRESGFILIRAEVFREPDDALPAATGHAYELRSAGHVQQGSYVEVCETSSVGRALALLGFETKRTFAPNGEGRTGGTAASPQRGGDSERDKKMRVARARGLVAGVEVEGDHYIVRQPTTKGGGQPLHFEVFKGDGGRTRCLCDDFIARAEAEADFECEHIMAVGLFKEKKRERQRVEG